ncbi:MAG TPA: hypothetical protein GXZ82_03510 [Firmicutes bacterium]|jgi:hypothetical protein|nr:hypothetical protein [Bacillota bacterium]
MKRLIRRYGVVCLLSALWLCATAFCCSAVGESAVSAEVYGAEANPTGDPIGGGAGYSKIVSTGDYIVSTRSEFLAALVKAKPGEVIYIAPDAQIDLSGLVNIQLPGGVTIAGNRGVDGSPGPLLYTTTMNTVPLLNIMQPNVRITGIRLRGPDPALPDGIAVRILSHDVEIDNCEIWNWSYAGIAIMRTHGAYIHHNYIHNVRRPGLGYPVVFDGATGLVEANIFDYYRHAIAGTGTKGTGYEARYNIVRANAISFAFDMHGGEDYCPGKTCTEPEKDIYMAGEWVHIHHNTFYITAYESIRIRGVPREYTEIHHNWFINPDTTRGVFFRYYRGGNAKVYQNVYGPEKRLASVQVEPSPFIYPEGLNTIVAMADGSKLEFGFAHPVDKAQVKGVVPVELLPVVAEGELGKTLTITGVEIKLAGRVLYKEDRWPKNGEVQIDTLSLADGTYALALRLDTNLGVPMQRTIYINVRNK